jgi:UDP-glucose 4-epimerase
VLDAVARASGRELPVVRAPRRAGDPVALVADNTRARELLCWTPQRTLDDIIASAWAWHSSHPDGFGSA